LSWQRTSASALERKSMVKSWSVMTWIAAWSAASYSGWAFLIFRRPATAASSSDLDEAAGESEDWA